MIEDAMSTPRGSSDPAQPDTSAAQRARLRELAPKTMWVTAGVIAVLTTAAVVVLWWPATAGLAGAELVSARLDALKIGLSVAVGSGGVVALYLSWRRQHSTEADRDNRERALEHQKYDAAERRLTDLYLKAVEQLGSPQAPVRHGGLYALERVAQDNPPQQQTVVNVICAYLRNPYKPPLQTSEPRPLGIHRPLLRSTSAPRTPTTSSDSVYNRESQLQEREVRLTAQRILQRHLHPGVDSDRPQATFWPEIEIDLTGAVLISFSLDGCQVATAAFTNAIFINDAQFEGTNFSGKARFDGATFTGKAEFWKALFTGRARFDRANLTSETRFTNATFADGARFSDAKFADRAGFERVIFTGNAEFKRAIFSDDATFRDARFTGHAGFERTTFAGDALFHNATFTGDALFNNAIFDDGAQFTGATRNRLPFDPT